MTHQTAQDRIVSIDLYRVSTAIFWICIISIALLVVADYVFNYEDILDDRSFRRIWNVAREQSIPTWFSSIQAQLLGVTVMLIGWVQSASIARYKTVIWYLIGLFFLWVGIDDFAAIHEKLGGVLERLAEEGENSAVTELMLKNPSFSWHTFIAPFFALCGLGIVAFLWLAFWRLRLAHFLVLGFGCWVVSQGIDFIEGLERAGDIYDWVRATLNIRSSYGVTHLIKVIEETLEMLGTTLLWVGFLRYLAHASDGLHLKLQRTGPDNA